MNENDYFETSDISLASALSCLGAKIEAIDKTNPSRAIFVIKRDKAIDGLIQMFWNRSLMVDALAYFNCLKELKNRLYNT